MNVGTLDIPTELRPAAAPADGFGGAPDEGEPGGHGQEGSAEGPSDGSSDGPSDGELAERAGRGDRRAFDTLTHRYHRQAVAVAYRLLGDSQDALDVAQEALFKAYTGLAGLEDPAAFGGWLMRIVSNLALNLRRGRRVRRTTGLDHVAAGAVAADPSARHNPPDPLDPARASESSEMAERLRDALAALPDKQREALVLFTMQGHTQRQVADAMGCSMEAVKWNVFQARKRIKQAMGDYLQRDRPSDKQTSGRSG